MAAARVLSALFVLTATLARTGPPIDRQVLELQILLDRAGFSPGEIDAHRGLNTTRALAAFAKAHRLKAADEFGARRELAGDNTPAIVTYTVTSDDVAGPFAAEIPSDLMAQAQLPALSYTSATEALAERFHVAPSVLEALNPGVALAEGVEIQVPNVKVLDERATAEGHAARVVVSRRESSATAYDGSGRVIFYAPVTSGSQHDPLPIGHWTVTGIDRHPSFNYDPNLFWDADATQAKAKIPPGPNNPVGIVWIDISKPHYGLHGTPEPSMIGHSMSHGCVRLTNWDAWRLAGLVARGTPVIFEE